jgi:hypothetical protein
LLAAAFGVPPETINFSFCHSVLQVRWVLECRHGCTAPAVHKEKWHGIGPIDPLSAILIKNK